MKNESKITFVVVATAAIFVAHFILSSDKKMVDINDDRGHGDKTEIIPREENYSAPWESHVPQNALPQTNWQPILDKHENKEISKGETDKKIIALTFDGGANADGTEKILDILKQENIKATFFLTGEFIRNYPDKTRSIIASGGNIGNHSFGHPHFAQLSDEKIISEIENAEAEFGKLGKKFDPIFRFPFGERDKRTMEKVSERGYLNIRWTVDSLGWKGASGGMTKDIVRDRVLLKATPGAIILMHLGSNFDDKTQLDSEALPEIVRELKSQGYEFVTVSKMLTSVE